MELTWHTGLSGDKLRLIVDWFDENNKHHNDIIEIFVSEDDKPRSLRAESSIATKQIKCCNLMDM